MTNQIPASRQSMRVLICDDEPRARQALKALLLTREVTCNDESSSIHVAGEARDGYEAVQLVKKILPEVVVIDACMPGMDGLEATRFIKKNWTQVRVIVLTMYPDQRAAALEAGADAFLLKGCLAETLIETILS
jgi:NarL family two-component system response regulator LiaR